MPLAGKGVICQRTASILHFLKKQKTDAFSLYGNLGLVLLPSQILSLDFRPFNLPFLIIKEKPAIIKICVFMNLHSLSLLVPLRKK